MRRHGGRRRPVRAGDPGDRDGGLVARWRSERRLDKLQVLLGRPNPVLRAYAIAFWLREPASSRPSAVNEALDYARSDDSQVPVCSGCLRGTTSIAQLVRTLDEGRSP